MAHIDLDPGKMDFDLTFTNWLKQKKYIDLGRLIAGIGN
jgi:hypothetical protein